MHYADAAQNRLYRATYPAACGAGSGTARPTRAHNVPQTEGLIDLTLSDSDAPPSVSE